MAAVLRRDGSVGGREWMMSGRITNMKLAGSHGDDPADTDDPALGFGLTRVGMVVLTVSDQQKALRFYRQVLGMHVRSMTPGWVELDAGGVVLALYPHQAKHPPAQGEPPRIVFDVDDVYEAYDVLKQRRVTFVTEPRIVQESGATTGMAATFLDPDHNVLSIYATLEKTPEALG